MAAPADTPLDAGSQALSEALRSSFAIIRFVMIVLVVVFFASGFFTVGPAQRAIILRFGKPLGEGALGSALVGMSIPPACFEDGHFRASIASLSS